MKYWLLMLTGFLFFPFCRQKEENAAKETSFTVTGHVKGLRSNDVVLLEYVGGERKPDTAVIRGEVFEFTGQVNEPLMGAISITDGVAKDYGVIDIALENTKISIEADKDSLNLAKIEGGEANKDLRSLKQILEKYDEKLQNISTIANGLEQTDVAGFKKAEQEYYTTINERTMTIKHFAMDHPRSVMSAFYTYDNLPGNIDDKSLDSIYNRFDEPVKNSVYGKKINELLIAARRLEIGNPAPELNMNDISGNPISLASYKGKVLLIDFWASWCAPCRAENPNLVKAYNAYKQKGFDILGVSLDNDKVEWLKAIEKDKLTWQHVSDLKQWESKAVTLYGLSSIPSNVLVSREGKVIAKDLRGEELETKLRELMP